MTYNLWNLCLEPRAYGLEPTKIDGLDFDRWPRTHGLNESLWQRTYDLEWTVYGLECFFPNLEYMV